MARSAWMGRVAPNKTGNLLASAARTATFNGNDQYNPGASGVRVRVTSTALAATPSVVFKIQGKTPAGAYEDLLTSAAMTTVSAQVLTVAPGVAASAGVTAQNYLPSEWRIRAEHADADSITYSATYEYLS